MLRILILSWLVAACARTTGTVPYTPPRVGDQLTSVTEFRLGIEGPGGTAHSTSTLELIAETLAVDDARVSRARFTIVRDESSSGREGMRGVFEIGDTPNGVEVLEVGGTLTAEERAYFTRMWTGSRAAGAGRKALAARSFTRGDRFTPTADEARGLGLQGVVELELSVRELSGSSVTFGTRMIAELPGNPGILLHATGTLRITATTQELVHDGELRKGTIKVGTLHLEQRSQRGRSGAAPR